MSGPSTPSPAKICFATPTRSTQGYAVRRRSASFRKPANGWSRAGRIARRSVSRTRCSDHRTVQAGPKPASWACPMSPSMSGPEHACLRQGIDENLSAEKVNGYIERLARPIINRFIESIRERGAADLTTELFEPISVRIIGDFVGFTEVDVDTLTAGSTPSMAACRMPNDPDAWAACERARNEIDDVMRPIVERVTSKPDHSLTSHVVHGGMAEGKVRGFDEIMPTMRVIVLGGLQEPGHGAANATFGLLQDPAQAVALDCRPRRAGAAGL